MFKVRSHPLQASKLVLLKSKWQSAQRILPVVRTSTWISVFQMRRLTGLISSSACNAKDLPTLCESCDEAQLPSDLHRTTGDATCKHASHKGTMKEKALALIEKGARHTNFG